MRKPGKRPRMLIGVFIATVALFSNPTAGSDIKTIDTARLHSMIVENAYRLEGGREKRFTVIDARTKEDYDEAHIFSAISIPVRDLEKLIDLLPKDRDALLVVYCNDTNFETSRTWAGKAAALGYANIAVYSEGFSVWRKKKCRLRRSEAAVDKGIKRVMSQFKKIEKINRVGRNGHDRTKNAASHVRSSYQHRNISYRIR